MKNLAQFKIISQIEFDTFVYFFFVFVKSNKTFYDYTYYKQVSSRDL